MLRRIFTKILGIVGLLLFVKPAKANKARANLEIDGEVVGTIDSILYEIKKNYYGQKLTMYNLNIDKDTIDKAFTNGRFHSHSQRMPFDVSITHSGIEVGKLKNVWLENGDFNKSHWVFEEIITIAWD